MANIPDAKNRILKSAVELFAAKSFEGARIDQIAKNAGVPKSLIYYHFKSKEEILAVLIENFLVEYQELIHCSKNNPTLSLSNRLKTHYGAFAKENVDLIRVMLIESLKNDKEDPTIFKVLDIMIKNDHEEFKDTEGYDQKERLVSEFFSGMLPLFGYLCLGDSWCQYYNMEKSSFDQHFLSVIETTHGAYHNDKHSFEQLKPREDKKDDKTIDHA